MDDVSTGYFRKGAGAPSNTYFPGIARILPLIELRRKLYYTVSVLTTVNCLDEEKSDICYAIDDPGYILSIRRYHLRNEMIPSGVSIFKIPQDVGTVFVTKPLLNPRGLINFVAVCCLIRPLAYSRG